VEKRLQIFLPDDVWAWFTKKKEQTHTSIAEMIRSAIRDYIKKQEQEQNK
jgi:metal-responsive CopG/Arc/MetJ family transcriptional regulator